jgi:uncharacterized protein (DUF2252 family)
MMNASSALGQTSIVTSSPDERRKAGAALRRLVPRSAHAGWVPPSDRINPIEILIEQGKHRIQKLLPIRYKRMRTDPFAFLRGAAAVMAADLASTPAVGIHVQACGDAHLANFGSYATPEGLPVFDINHFDETLPAPFEWDLKRLTTSLVVAGRVAHYSEKASRSFARIAARAYREHMAELAALSPVDAWNQRIDLARAVSTIDESKLRDTVKKHLAQELESITKHFSILDDGANIREMPPFVLHPDRDHDQLIRAAFSSYMETLPEERRVLLQRYALRDVTLKVSGVSDVGTFCAIVLLLAGDGSPLLLQIKEAQASVLAPFAGPSHYANHGERVVVGQRMMQSTTDMLLGWTGLLIDNRYFYVRHLQDPGLAQVEGQLREALPFYAWLCGLTLVRAHARTGDPAVISGYVGSGTVFDNAISEFAVAYADQVTEDWNSFCAANIADQGIATEGAYAISPPPGATKAGGISTLSDDGSTTHLGSQSMAYSVHYRIANHTNANGVFGFEFRPPEGERRQGQIPYADLQRIASQLFGSVPPPAGELGKALYDILFRDIEGLLDEAIARGQQEPDRLTHILLDAGTNNQRFPWELAALGRPQATTPQFEIIRWAPHKARLIKRLPTLPFRVLVADMALADKAQPAFPLRSLLLNLLGQPDNLTQIIHPSEMTGTTRDDLRGLLLGSHFEIVHLQVLSNWLHPGQPGAISSRSEGIIDAAGEGPQLNAQNLLRLFDRSGTRLLILHQRSSTSDYIAASQLADLGRGIIERGGPATLIVPFGNKPDDANAFLVEIYAGIIHDLPLDTAVSRARQHWRTRASADSLAEHSVLAKHI